MTVIFSKKCELALQAVLFLSAQSEGKCFSAQEISDELNIPKEFVSKILQSLTSGGIVASKKGKAGGFYLAKDPVEIKLVDIVEAVDGLEVFHKCVLGFPGCSVNKPCPVHDKWGPLREAALKMLSDENLQDFKDKTIEKLQDLKTVSLNDRLTF